jgi:hypothetical protein
VNTSSTPARSLNSTTQNSAPSKSRPCLGTVAFSSSRKARRRSRRLGRVGAVDPVTDFGNGHRAEHDGNVSNYFLDTLDSLIWPQIPALGGNQDTGVMAGGAPGSLLRRRGRSRRR